MARQIPFEKRLSPEMNLLLMAARPFLSEAEGQELHSLCQAVTDWQAFLALIGRHRVPGLVYSNLNRWAREDLPPEIYRSLRRQAENNRRHELALSAEMVRLTQLFNAAGIEALFFKGTGLSIQVYGNLGLRHAKDVDVLIRPADLDAAARLLEANGYKIQDADAESAGRQKRAYQRFYWHLRFISQQYGHALELHWRFEHNPYYVPSDFTQEGFEHAETLYLGGEPLKILCREDHFICLCAHGAWHGWFRLKWLCDIAACLRAPQSPNWESISARIAPLGLERPVVQAVTLAGRLLGTPLPSPLQKIGKQAPIPARLIELAERFLLAPEIQFSPTGRLHRIAIGSYRMRLRREPKFKLEALAQIWMDERDWRDFPLPSSLFFLYYFLRPFLWLRRYHVRRGISSKRDERNGKINE